MMRWFGRASFAPICDEVPHVPTPTGVPCQWCADPIDAADNGLFFSGETDPIHHECFIRQIAGSVGHQCRQCSCYGGDGDGDPPSLTKHEAAILAFAYWATHGPRLAPRPISGPPKLH